MHIHTAKTIIQLKNKLSHNYVATLKCLVKALEYCRNTGTIFYKSIMPLAYADDVDIIGRSICEVEAALSKFGEEARSIGLSVNESKTKLLLSTAKYTSIGVSVEIDGYNFEVVKDFVYLGYSINTDNDISLEIRRRNTLANRCYFGLRKQLSKEALSWRTKIYLYKSLILLILLYGSET